MKSYRTVIIVFTLILSGLAALPVLASQWKVDVSWERFAEAYQRPLYAYSVGCSVGRPGSIFAVYAGEFLPYEEIGLLVNGQAPFFEGSQTFSLQANESGEVMILLHADSSEPSGSYLIQFVGADQRIARTYVEVKQSAIQCIPYQSGLMIFEIPNIANLPLIIR